MKYKPYSIIMPPFNPLSGGIRVMWGLYGWLLAKGQIVYANSTMVDSKFIAVYPEIFHGNDAKADTVVRYILNKPGVMGGINKDGVWESGPTEYPKDDHIFVFSKIYDTFGVDEDHLLFLPILNLHLFKDMKKKRTNRCVFVGKGKDIPMNVTEGLPRITRELSMDQGKLAEFLNTCDVMYSFENPTAMNEIARLCGCKVVFIPENATIKYDKEELAEKYEPTDYGIEWGLGKKKSFDSKRFRGQYLWLVKQFEKKLDKFIEITQK